MKQPLELVWSCKMKECSRKYILLSRQAKRGKKDKKISRQAIWVIMEEISLQNNFCSDRRDELGYMKVITDVIKPNTDIYT